MKITFFKNESHFWFRTSYVWENAEQVMPQNHPHLKTALTAVSLTAILLYTVLFHRRFFAQTPPYAAVIFLLANLVHLPIHELCHALYCVLTGRRVERICFFPFWRKASLAKASAYVHPELGAWTRSERCLFVMLPQLCIALPTAILALILPAHRWWLLFLTLHSITCGSGDFTALLSALSVPDGSIYFDSFWLRPDKEAPTSIHRLRIAPGSTVIEHHQFRLSDGRLLPVTPPSAPPILIRLYDEFIQQFGPEVSLSHL